MKLLGWTIVLSGLVVGIAACTVETTDETSDGGTAGAGGGTAGTGGSAGSTAGAAGSTAGAAGEAGAGGSAGAATCEVTDADAATACDLCAAQKCCAEWLACEDDTGDPPAITVPCKQVYECAAACDSGDYLTCLQGCDSEANPKVTAFYECVYLDANKCANECAGR